MGSHGGADIVGGSSGLGHGASAHLPDYSSEGGAASPDDGLGGYAYASSAGLVSNELRHGAPHVDGFGQEMAPGSASEDYGLRLEPTVEKPDRSQRRRASSRDPPPSGACAARAKLDEARCSLHLVGNAAAQHVERPGPASSVSERATSSQTKARLQDIQRKRAELIRKRCARA